MYCGVDNVMKKAIKTATKRQSKRVAKKVMDNSAQAESLHKSNKWKRLGILERPGFVLPEEFYEPLPDDELKLWNGEDN